MADSTQFSFDVQDKRLVIEWRDKAEELNKEAKTVTDEATTDLQTFAEAAVGNFFNEVASLCSSVLEGMKKILEGMQQIISAVDAFVTKLEQVIGELFSGASSSKKTVMGY